MRIPKLDTRAIALALIAITTLACAALSVSATGFARNVYLAIAVGFPTAGLSAALCFYLMLKPRFINRVWAPIIISVGLGVSIITIIAALFVERQYARMTVERIPQYQTLTRGAPPLPRDTQICTANWFFSGQPGELRIGQDRLPFRFPTIKEPTWIGPEWKEECIALPVTLWTNQEWSISMPQHKLVWRHEADKEWDRDMVALTFVIKDVTPLMNVLSPEPYVRPEGVVAAYDYLPAEEQSGYWMDKLARFPKSDTTMAWLGFLLVNFDYDFREATVKVASGNDVVSKTVNEWQTKKFFWFGRVRSGFTFRLEKNGLAWEATIPTGQIANLQMPLRTYVFRGERSKVPEVWFMYTQPHEHRGGNEDYFKVALQPTTQAGQK